MQGFKRLLHECTSTIILDGAMGTLLQEKGLPAGICPEVWSAEHPAVLESIAREYMEAGSMMVYTGTFGANPWKLAEYGITDTNAVVSLNSTLASIARRAAGGKALVAGDIGPSGRFVEPFGNMKLEEAISGFRMQIRGLVEGGVDLIVIETMIDIQEARCALIAAKEESPDCPVMVTMTFEADGRTLNGTTPAAAAVILSSLGADAVGCNCSSGPEEMLALVKEMASVTQTPIVAKPNAGMPILTDGKTGYSMTPRAFARHGRVLADTGVRLVGGCCGTRPAHIAALASELSQCSPLEYSADQKQILASAREICDLASTGKTLVIGERINPTGKKLLAGEFREGSVSLALEMARSQKAAGADLLDINCGAPGVDEKSFLPLLVREISARSTLSLVIDTTNPDALEAALRIYPGRALVNSIPAESGKRDRIIPILAKYGAMAIILPVSPAGVPHTASERLALAGEIITAAGEAGIPRTRFIIDPLVLTASSAPEGPAITLETISLIRKKGLLSVMGLSNVSFGLPARTTLNTAFLAMGIAAGLNLVIANPEHEELMLHLSASDLLTGRDPGSRSFISRAGGTIQAQKTQSADPRANLRTAILEGDKKALLKNLEHLRSLHPAREILDDIMIPAVIELGNLYEEKKIFLPQLMAGAEIMRAGFHQLEDELAADSPGNGPTVIIATVEGDIHDIGKNIVKLMIQNQGLRVVDLGKDVPASEIVAAARREAASVVCLSALMTTTMVRMPEVITALRADGMTCPVMVGGAVVTREWAGKIGAHYSPDGAQAARLAVELCSGSSPLKRD